MVEVMEAIRKVGLGQTSESQQSLERHFAPRSTLNACDSNMRTQRMFSKNGPIRLLFRLYDEGYLSCAVGDHIARMYISGPIADGVPTSAKRVTSLSP